MQPEEGNKEQAGVTQAQEEPGTRVNITQASVRLRKKKKPYVSYFQDSSSFY